MLLNMNCDGSQNIMRWVTEEPELSALFVVREEDIYLKRSVPASVRKDLLTYGLAAMHRIVDRGVRCVARTAEKEREKI